MSWCVSLKMLLLQTRSQLDGILPVSERVQFTEEDERRFSLAGYLARKKHARDDKEAGWSTTRI